MVLFVTANKITRVVVWWASPSTGPVVRNMASKFIHGLHVREYMDLFKKQLDKHLSVLTGWFQIFLCGVARKDVWLIK